MGLVFIDLEQMNMKIREKRRYFEMAFMNRFSEEKMPAA